MLWIIGCFTACALLMLWLRKAAFFVGMGVVFTCAMVSLFPPLGIDHFLQSLDYRARDFFFQTRGPEKPTGEVVIVDIDHKSLQEVGQWPWPRAAIAQVVRNIHADGARTIGFDIVFAEPDRLSLKDWAPRLGAEVATPADPAESGPDHIAWDNDLALAKAFYECRVVAGGMLSFETSRDKAYVNELERESAQEQPGMVLSSAIGDATSYFPLLRRGNGQVLNTETIQQGTLHQGAFNLVPDLTGVARHYHMLLAAPTYTTTLELKPEAANLKGAARFDPENYETKILKQEFVYPSLALEMLRCGNGYDQTTSTFREGQPGLLLAHLNGFQYPGTHTSSVPHLGNELWIPLDEAGDIEINYRGYGGKWQPNSRYSSQHYFTYISLADVLENRFEPGTFTGKYALLGSTDPTLFDLIGSPFNSAYPGLEVHATILDNLIRGDHFRPWTTHPHALNFFLILFGGTLLAIIYAYTSPRKSGLVTLILLAGLPLLSYYLLAVHHITFPFVLPWFSTAGLSAAGILTSFFVENRDRRFVVQQFGQLVSEEVLDQLRDNPEEASLGGRRVELSVMFSDLAGFTSISESMSPTELVALLNDYLTPMCDVIMTHRGYIDKFIGDAVMACWGIPYPDEEHAKHACLAALEQQEALAQLRAPIKEKYGVDLYARMGISTGEASAALMGSDRKKNYTVLGDMVNLGARLEPACKTYGAEIMICATTWKEAQEVIEGRVLDKLVVKGKTEPILIYELAAKKGELPPERRELFEKYEKALQLHWKREWKKALKLLEEIRNSGPVDEASEQLYARILDYQQQPPADGWQGEHCRTTK